MRAGLLRQRVTIQRRAEGERDELGQPSPVEFRDIGTYYAEVKPLTGKELLEARQVSPRLSHAVALRGRIDVHPADRIVLPGGVRVLEIVSVADRDERRREQMLSCQEVVLP